VQSLQKIDPQESRKIEEHLNKIRNSATVQELQKKLDALKEYAETKAKEKNKKPSTQGKGEPWQVYIIPERLVIPIGSSVSLKSIAVYNNVLIKDAGSELEWFSTDPAVASVNEEGMVYSLTKGSARINATYRGQSVYGTEVVVVDKITEGVDEVIRDALIGR
jgi:hypothetical protein